MSISEKKKKLPEDLELAEQKYKSKGPVQNRRGGPGGRGHGPGGPPGMGGMPAEKAKDFKGTLSKVLKYIGQFKWPLVLVAMLSVLSSVFNILAPKVQGNAITVIELGYRSGQVDGGALLRVLLLLAGIYLLTSGFGFVQQWTVTSVSQRMVFRLRKDIEAKLSKLPLRYFDSQTHGEILSRVTNDVDTVSNTLQQCVTQIISAAITLVGVLAMMLYLSPVLTGISLCIIPFYLLVIYVIAPRSQRYFIGQARALGDLNGHVEEMYTGHKIVKAFGHEEDSIREYEEINERYYTYSRKAQVISGMIMPCMMFLGNLGYVLMAVAGGFFVATGRFLLGDMQAFLQYIRSFNQPINQLSSIANTLQSTIASAERIFEILEQPEEVAEAQSPKRLANPQGAVSFDHIEFGYTPDNILIHDMNIQVQPGQTVAIVGPTGAGKTTLVNLLMRFYDVSKGSISVDGVDIRDMTRSDLRSLFGMVLQDTWLFTGTIRDNIAYGRPKASDEEVIAAATAARADHFIRTLYEGYQTVLNEEGTSISQGQRQLLTIARAFLADPAILILDEATSSVDTRTEILIQKAMEALMKGRTSFVIAHRLSTIRDADLILVMNHGDIVEQGTHDQLMEKQGFYYDLYNSQFSGNTEEAAS